MLALGSSLLVRRGRVSAVRRRAGRDDRRAARPRGHAHADDHQPRGHWLFGLPVGYALCFVFGFGVIGLWIGLSTGLIIAGVVLLYAWHRQIRNLQITTARRVHPASCRRITGGEWYAPWRTAPAGRHWLHVHVGILPSSGRSWFSAALGTPTPAQAQGWAAIRDRRHTLIAAPTGSGKTLAAFLNALDDLLCEGLARAAPDEVRVVYVSPLKALSADIHKNLAEPRRGIAKRQRALGLQAPAHHRGRAHRRHDHDRTCGDAADAAAHSGDDTRSRCICC